MLHIHFSNDTERLADLLLHRLRQAPASPFDAEQLIVPGTGMRRYLELRCAQAFGISANLDFSFPAAWIWRQVTGVLGAVGEESPYSADIMRWRVLGWLHDPRETKARRLATYVEHSDALMLYELATRIARQLEQLVTYRQDWLSAWADRRSARLPEASAAQREDEAWLAAAWRHIVRTTGGPPEHPTETLLKALSGPESAAHTGLPARVSLFGLAELPPLYLEFMARLAQHIDVDVYVFNPCREYWFDIVSESRRARLAALGRQQHLEVGNSLLAHWGEQTRAFLETLVAQAEGETIDVFEDIAGDAMLHAVQQHILQLEELPAGSLTLDDSISIDACHSLTRQLEVLQDRLLALFAADPDLQASDVLVVLPTLDEAAAAIEAVFGTLSADDRRYIPWRITGLGGRSAAPLTRALLALLELPGARFEASLVHDLLQQSSIARRFGLEGDSLDLVHHWMREAGMRWGRNAAHRATLGLPASPRHTLDHGFRQLFFGYALPLPEGEVFAGLLPCTDIEGQRAGQLGAFWLFVSRLEALADALQQARTTEAWASCLNQILDDFFEPGPADVAELLRLRAAIAGWSRQSAAGGAADMSLPIEVLRHALGQQVEEQAPGGTPGGVLSFTGMSPLRQLPYRHVCVLGLDHNKFPADTPTDEFDLLAAFPRKGDRQRRRDDRNVFLDLLMSARDGLHLSYTGQHIRDNSSVPPSVVVSELIDVLVRAGTTPDCAPEQLVAARARLVTHHPIQAYSPRYFLPEPSSAQRIFSYNGALCHAIAQPRATQAGAFFSQALPPPDPGWRSLTPADLVRFLRQPVAALLKQRLHIGLWSEDEELADDEPFALDRKDSWRLRERILDMVNNGLSDQQVRQAAQLDNTVPDGIGGALDVEPHLQAAHLFSQRLKALAPSTPARRQGFELACGPFALSGELSGLYDAGQLLSRFGKITKAVELEAWVHHLVLCCVRPAGVAACTQWLGDDGEFHFIAPTNASALLHDLLDLYWDGLQRPLHFFPKTSAAFEAKDIKAAFGEWIASNDRGHGESEHAAYQLVFGEQPQDALNARFEELARCVFGPLRSHRQKGVHDGFR
jgi:exodeoxyribonuclease V gamma subunit